MKLTVITSCSNAKKYLVNSPLGCFRLHSGQLSENLNSYFTEANQFLMKENFLIKIQARLDWLVWRMPPKIKKWLNSSQIIYFDPRTNDWVIS